MGPAVGYSGISVGKPTTRSAEEQATSENEELEEGGKCWPKETVGRGTKQTGSSCGNLARWSNLAKADSGREMTGIMAIGNQRMIQNMNRLSQV